MASNETALARCTRCGVLEHINLLDGKPDNPKDPDNCDWNKIECISCYGSGWLPMRGKEDIELSVVDAYKPLYTKWARVQAIKQRIGAN